MTFIAYLVVVLVGRILFQQAVVQLDGFERTGALEVVLHAFGQLTLQHVLHGGDAVLLGSARFQLLLGAHRSGTNVGGLSG
jgi:hypothetical protein